MVSTSISYDTPRVGITWNSRYHSINVDAYRLDLCGKVSCPLISLQYPVHMEIHGPVGGNHSISLDLNYFPYHSLPVTSEDSLFCCTINSREKKS